jgi:O-antigen/teichoic acid export membrane protein
MVELQDNVEQIGQTISGQSFSAQSGFCTTSPSRRRAAVIMLVGGYVSLGVTIVQGLVLVPLYLHYIGARVYGAWLGSGGILGWLSILEFGIASVMIQRMAGAYGKGDMKSVSGYFSIGLLSQMGLMVLLVVCAIGLSFFVPGWMGLTSSESTQLAVCFVLAAFSTGFNILNNGVSGLAQALQVALVINITSTIAGILGLAATLILLLSGYGLWSLPVGLLVRNGTLLIANAIHSGLLLRTRVRFPMHIDRRLLNEFMSLSPFMFAGSLSNSIVGQSEPALIAMLIRPELATVFVLTRRAADVIKMILDRITGAVYPGFAHLFGEGNREQAYGILKQIMGIYTVSATVMFSLYLALNRSFIGLWVGEKQFGGHWLTFLIAVSLFLSIRNNLLTYLYGATGEIAKSTMMIVLESLIRLALMLMLLWQLGLLGLPVAMLLTGIPMNKVIAHFMTIKIGLSSSKGHVLSRLLPNPIYAILLALGLLIGILFQLKNWLHLVAMGLGSLAFCVIVLVVADSLIRSYYNHLMNRFLSIVRSTAVAQPIKFGAKNDQGWSEGEQE